MKVENRNFTIRLTSPMLGTVPKNPDIYKSYIADKAAKLHPKKKDEIDEEVETVVEQLEEKGWTGFHQDENGLFIYDYMIKGFFKAAIEVLMTNGLKKIPAYKKWIDTLVFVYPRKIYLGKQEPDQVVERPLRAMTAQGPRVSLVRSDAVGEGTELAFNVEILNNSKEINFKLIEQALKYGQYHGLGQWRGSGGYGRFEMV